MLLNSESQKGQNSSSNDSSMKFSNKNKFQSFINYSVKKAKNHSKFYSMSLRNSKKMNSNPRINIIINNNNPINYANTPSSMYINSFSQEKKLKRTKSHDQNSTFVFTGDNQSSMDNGQIIENYLRNPLENPIFECKSLSSISNREQNEIIPSQEKSFALSSSLTSNTPNTTGTIPKSRNNKNLIKMLKLINTDSGNKKNGINNKELNDTNCKRKIQKIEMVSKDNKNDKKKKIGFFMFLIINLLIYFNLLVMMFQPPAQKLFYDNDHIDYKYTISSLSHEKGIVITEDK
jgi:hypothetical protein